MTSNAHANIGNNILAWCVAKPLEYMIAYRKQYLMLYKSFEILCLLWGNEIVQNGTILQVKVKQANPFEK